MAHIGLLFKITVSMSPSDYENSDVSFSIIISPEIELITITRNIFRQPAAVVAARRYLNFELFKSCLRTGNL